MAVYKHKNGRWYYRFQIRGIRYHAAIPEATDKKQAEKAEIKIKAEFLNGNYGFVEYQKEITFFSLCENFEEFAKNNRKNFQKDFGIVKKLKAFYGNCKISDFTPFKIEEYRTKRVSEAKKPATINKEVGVLRRMFSIAVDNGWMKQNPALKKSIKPMRVENIEKKVLSVQEEQRLIGACQGDCAFLKPIIICALHSAMRKTEILSLEWKNVDLDKKTITILAQKNGKKSYIPISNALEKELCCLKSNSKSEYVFTNPLTDKPYVNIRNSFNKILNVAKIKNFTFHSLRHTACTRMLERGVSIDVVREIMRHSNIAITLEVYNHINQNRKMEAIHILENYGN